MSHRFQIFKSFIWIFNSFNYLLNKHSLPPILLGELQHSTPRRPHKVSPTLDSPSLNFSFSFPLSLFSLQVIGLNIFIISILYFLFSYNSRSMLFLTFRLTLFTCLEPIISLLLDTGRWVNLWIFGKNTR